MGGSLRSWMRRHALLLLQIFLILALAIYIARGFDVEEFLQAFSQIDPHLLLYLVLFEIAYYLTHALAYWALAYRRFRVPVKDAIGGTMVAWLVDLLLPSAFIEGDIVRIVFLKQYGEWAEAISYGLFFRFLLNITLSVFILAASLLALNVYIGFSNYLAVYISAVVLALLSSAVIALFIFDTKRVKRLSARLVSRLPVGNKQTLIRDLGRFLDYVSETSRDFSPYNLYLWLSVLALMGQWISGVLTPYFSLKCVGIDVNPLLIAPGYTILSTLSLVSIGVPFMIGSVDAALITLYLVLGVPKERAVVAALIGRSVTIIVTLTLIYPIGMYYSRKIFSKKNLEGIKETINRIAKEYGIEFPFVKL
ncbi:flippase-like domain-containing protein [Infirmifilum lucidum]|uniref:Flippase-like domain-containing protein n=1 Tax=Infirmifilum lucidum TaxID=2776706 RepID=A0A7L9FHM5_9CREN|nr:lysylphosphatidylglycerol synthase transmembrane domain-containing protein [Infirmifilum lucidum]QOJ78416.1 flippase-like domain-containing protein [Infirmifilum lucidum]